MMDHCFCVHFVLKLSVEMFLRDGLPGKELVYAHAQFDDRDPLKNAAPLVATFCHWLVYSIGSSKQLPCGF